MSETARCPECDWIDGEHAPYCPLAVAPTRPEPSPPFVFKRYIGGVEMAEGVTIERDLTLENAMKTAARVASRGSNGEVPVLVFAPPCSTAMNSWQDDPSADERWNAGLDFGQQQLCKYLGVDPDDVTWDAATEELEGDVQAVIGNIMRAKFGEDWTPRDGAIYAALSRASVSDAEHGDLMRDIDTKLGDLGSRTDAMTESVVQDDRYSTAIVWSDEDQAYLASTPELPGCIADGQTKAEALRELADARAVWIGAATEIGKTIPGPTTLDNFPDGIATSKAPQAGLEPLYRGAAPEAWQDISTAPTYETILVAGGDANYPVTACWDGDPQDGWYVDGQEDTHVEIGWPTHWMPLPEGPAVARNERVPPASEGAK